MSFQTQPAYGKAKQNILILKDGYRKELYFFDAKEEKPIPKLPFPPLPTKKKKNKKPSTPIIENWG